MDREDAKKLLDRVRERTRAFSEELDMALMGKPEELQVDGDEQVLVDYSELLQQYLKGLSSYLKFYGENMQRKMLVDLNNAFFKRGLDAAPHQQKLRIRAINVVFPPQEAERVMAATSEVELVAVDAVDEVARELDLLSKRIPTLRFRKGFSP